MSSEALNKHNIVDFILDLFSRRGAEEYLGESVSMAQHMEQTAACAVADAAADSLVASALLHDIGHFVGDFPIDALEKGVDNRHEEAGSQFLAPWFPASVTEPIRLHVAAKRYLCKTDEGYFDRLSAASVNSLRVQGGPMNADEVRQFESSPYYRDAVKARLYDDDGKIAGLTIKPVREYRKMLESLLLDQANDGVTIAEPN